VIRESQRGRFTRGKDHNNGEKREITNFQVKKISKDSVSEKLEEVNARERKDTLLFCQSPNSDSNSRTTERYSQGTIRPTSREGYRRAGGKGERDQEIIGEIKKESQRL